MTGTNTGAGCEPLERLVEAYRAELERLGFREVTIRHHLRTVRALCQLAEAAGITLDALTPERAMTLLHEGAAPAWRCRAGITVARRFAAHVAATTVFGPPAPPPAWQAAREVLLRDYADHLRRACGLGERTVGHLLGMARRFLAFRFGEGTADPAAITPADVAGFLHGLVTRRPPYRDKTPPTHLRGFLRYLFRAGLTPVDLSLAVPSVAQRYDARLPRHLAPEAVEAVLAAVRAAPRLGRRNHAMVLLLARLGLRAQEVVAIRLEDLDWRSGELLVRGKGGLHDRLPLPPDVGEAIAAYLRYDRVSACRALFVTHHAPHGAFRNGQVLNVVLRAAFARTGVALPPRHVGSHVLRHSLAASLVRRGASLDEVAEVLRHRSRATTLLYARLDVEGLRAVAQPWPAAGGAR